MEAEETGLSDTAETAGVEDEGGSNDLESNGAAGIPEGEDAETEDAGVGALPSEGESADEVTAASSPTTPAADRLPSPSEDRLHSNDAAATAGSDLQDSG